ncbi:lysis protein [Xenorhabdus nematophila]|nr:lysis protein [Xenorhabdus nematophila]
MKFNSQYFTPGAFVIVAGLLWFYYSEYQQKAKDYDDLNGEYLKQVIAIKDQQERIKHFAELDTKYIQELANATTEISKLRNAANAHPERMYIQARCPVPKTTASSGMDDAATARPTDAAIRNYWLLRERIATAEQIILGLQEYVRTQCQ